MTLQVFDRERALRYPQASIRTLDRALLGLGCMRGSDRSGAAIRFTRSQGAGARTSITSLWKVDDAATRRLFEIFYTKLWKEKLGKADALWQAKMALRSEGHPVRDWAGWVLTGDPD